VPSWLFMGVSYTGFFISPDSSPARAAVAVIPILIMRQLCTYVYDQLPPASVRIWLIDWILVANILVCLSTLQFALVQACRRREQENAANLAMLAKTKDSAVRLIEEARQNKQMVISLLDHYHPLEKAETRQSYCQGLRPVRGRTVSLTDAAVKGHMTAGSLARGESDSEESMPEKSRYCEPFLELWGQEERDEIIGMEMHETEKSVMDLILSREELSSPRDLGMTTEGDLAVIKFFISIYETENHRDPSNKRGFANPDTLRRILTHFNVYVTKADAATIMCMFLRDHGFDTPRDESRAVMLFSHVIELLFEIDKYRLISKPCPWWRSPCTQALPWSDRLDAGAQMVFPLLVALHTLLMLAMLNHYPDDMMISTQAGTF